jgi:hypothetical protein
MLIAATPMISAAIDASIRFGLFMTSSELWSGTTR